MIIIFDATRPVKTASARPFGAGLVRSLPVYRADHTAADERWLAEQNAAGSDLDRRADEAAAFAAYERGFAFF